VVYFQTKNPNLGKFCRAMQWKMAVWYLLRPFGIFGCHFDIFYGHFGIFSPVLVSRTKKNLATLISSFNPSFFPFKMFYVGMYVHVRRAF
jgi:hypothetical protein